MPGVSGGSRPRASPDIAQIKLSGNSAVTQQLRCVCCLPLCVATLKLPMSGVEDDVFMGLTLTRFIHVCFN